MLTIRLTRKGKKNQPFFRVVVIDKRRSSKGGKSVEDLGYVNPLTKKKSLNKERILYWISKGARPSDTMNNLLVAEKIIEAEKIHVSKLSKKKKAELSAKKVEAEAKAKASASAEASADKKEPKAPESPVEVPAEASVESAKEPATNEEKPAQ